MANIELDGANKKIKVDSGDLTLDVPGDIVLDADGGDVVFADGGTNLLKVTNSSSDVVLQPQVDTKDIVFKQYDGTTVATVEDNATFNIPASKLAIGGTAVTSTAAELNIVDGGTSATSTTIADADRVVLNDNGTMVQAAVTDLKTYIGGALTSLGSSDSNDAAGDVTFDNVFSDTYSRYIIYIDTMMPVDDGASLYFRFRKSDGSGGYEDESRTGYVYHVRHIRNGSTSDYNDGASSGGAQTFGRISGAVKNSTGEHGLKAIVNVYRPGTRQSQATMTYVRCDGTYRSHANDDSMSVVLSSACNNYHTDAMLGIKFYFSGGNIDDNKIRVYGVTT